MTRPLIRALVVAPIAACFLFVARSAQAQVAPADALLSVDQAKGAFTAAGYRVDQALNWNWTSPPVTSFQVHDLASGRVLMVLVYPSATAAQAGRLQAEAHGLAPNALNPVSSSGPHLMVGYGPSMWTGNVAIVETTEMQLQSLFQVQQDHEDDRYTGADPGESNLAVDLDLQQALTNIFVNL
jgi:hypothetical protein